TKRKFQLEEITPDNHRIIEKETEETGEQQFQLECKFGMINICYSTGEHEELGISTYSKLDTILPGNISI
ncbi:5184_t:CDS:2, partial [Cetraspora pellucida]